MKRENFINGLKETIRNGDYKPFPEEQLHIIRKMHMATIKPEDFPDMPNGENDIHICIEECGELIQSLTKILRGVGGDPINLLEELADVQVCIERMKVVFNISDDVFQAACAVKEKRLNRVVLERLEKDITNGSLQLGPIKSAYIDKYDVNETVNAILTNSDMEGENDRS